MSVSRPLPSLSISVLIGVRVIKVHGDLPVLTHLIPLIVSFDDIVYMYFMKSITLPNK